MKPRKLMGSSKTRWIGAASIIALCPAVVIGQNWWRSGPGRDYAQNMTFDGSYSEFIGIYEIGEPFLHPSIRMQPLKAAKDSAAAAVEIIKDSGYDDLVGAVAYSGVVSWVEELSGDYDRVRSRIRGTPVANTTRIDLGIQAARIVSNWSISA